MAEKVIYIGSTGPFLFDDAEDMPRQPGVSQIAVRTDSQMIVTEAPVEDDNILRLQDLRAAIWYIQVADIDNPTEIAAVEGAHVCSLLMAYEAGDPAKFTLYSWDPTVTSDNSPFVVVSGSGAWIAIAGENNYYDYFWTDGTTVGFKLRRDNIWAYFKLNSSYNGLTIDHLENA